MLSQMLKAKLKAKNYEVLFLRNDADQDVEVHEVEHVDFQTVEERLERGESVFITSKRSQKVAASPPKSKTPSAKTRMMTAFYIDPV